MIERIEWTRLSAIVWIDSGAFYPLRRAVRRSSS